jgi:hypothetical protein
MADKQAVKQVDIWKGEDKEKWEKHYHHSTKVGLQWQFILRPICWSYTEFLKKSSDCLY